MQEISSQQRPFSAIHRSFMADYSLSKIILSFSQAHIIDWSATDLEVATVGQRYKNGTVQQQVQHQWLSHPLQQQLPGWLLQTLGGAVWVKGYHRSSSTTGIALSMAQVMSKANLHRTSCMCETSCLRTILYSKSHRRRQQG